ncbi:MAG: TIGR03619 family F420-dependent LLM class oxidoreductase [Actinomycetota bacterium]|nr:TIGR03619 family F420-dependent LLM class oxidoreductase [Actinomycetota bacterium]
MKFVTDYPVRSDLGGIWIQPETIASGCKQIEAAGFHGLGITDHPAPSLKWLHRGGHEAFDPFGMLSFMAAVTTRVNLLTHLLVVPYRNPLLQLSGMTTVDVLSGGRAIFVLGTGYLRSEFSALGVEFDERNALFDEAIAVFKQASVNEEITYEGLHFNALGQTVQPSFVQKPHPPLWLGGNSTRVMERLAEWGEGWSVMMGPAELSTTARTKPISTIDDLRVVLKDLQSRVEANGRSMDEISIQASHPAMHADVSAEQKIDAIGELAEIGVSWVVADVWTDSVSESADRIQQFSEQVIARTT